METMIKIGSEVSKETAKNLGDLYDRLFTSAAKHRMDQETVRAALSGISNALSVNGTTISGCNINGDKTINT